MDKALKILPTGTLDFLSLGALVHRLDPGLVPFRKAMPPLSTSAAASTTSRPTWPTASA